MPFLIGRTPTIAIPWTEYFDNTRWAPGTPSYVAGSWDGSKWVSRNYACGGCYFCYLSILGAWVNGYRPSVMRVSWSNVTTILNMCLKDSGGSSLGSDSGISVSPVEISLTFGSNNIAAFEADTMNQAGQFYITNIEFM